MQRRNMDRAQFGPFDAVRLERNMMFFILFFIIIVAAFSIMNTLITVTVQKRREIGILKALGANVWQIVWVVFSRREWSSAFSETSPALRSA